MQARRSLKRSLEPAAAKAMSPGESRSWQIPTKSPPNPSSIHQVESIQFVGSVGSVGFIASIHPKKRNIPYWYCPHCTPSLTLPPSSLKCLQKSNPGIHIKCFRCFKCFGCFRCFMFAFGPQNRPILVQIRTNPKNRHPPASAI